MRAGRRPRPLYSYRMGRLDERTRSGLLALYDVPDPEATGQRIPGYDRDHAARATEIVLLVASGLGLDDRWQRDLEITALLHDIGRAGMEPTLFGQVFSLAAELGLPVRAKELRSKYPEVDEREATAFFLDLIGPSLRERGIPVDDTLIDHIRMRMDFKGRLRQVLDDKRQDLDRLGVSVHPWMEKVMLYYYYPEEMTGEAEEARLMGMTLVACENLRGLQQPAPRPRLLPPGQGAASRRVHRHRAVPGGGACLRGRSLGPEEGPGFRQVG